MKQPKVHTTVKLVHSQRQSMVHMFSMSMFCYGFKIFFGTFKVEMMYRGLNIRLIFSHHMTNCFLVGILIFLKLWVLRWVFEEVFISFRNASHRKFKLKSSFKIYRNSGHKEMYHVRRLKNFYGLY